MKIIHYPHPSLRHQSKPVARVDAELRKMIEEMFELMYEAKGIGLAANQVDLPMRLFVANLAAESGSGEEMVFINPVVSRAKGNEEAEEGCLSLPGIYGQVKRPKQIHIQAYNLQGEEISGEVKGLLSRVIQHETDHLDGVLFIDRLSESGRHSVSDALEEMETVHQSRRSVGEIPPDAAIAERLRELEQQYC